MQENNVPKARKERTSSRETANRVKGIGFKHVRSLITHKMYESNRFTAIVRFAIKISTLLNFSGRGIITIT